MRNLMEYPITQAEIAGVLTECLDDWKKHNANDPIYGDMTGVCLTAAIILVATSSSADLAYMNADIRYSLNNHSLQKE
jgi:hypothetical protein